MFPRSLVPSRPRRFRMWRHLSSLSGKFALGSKPLLVTRIARTGLGTSPSTFSFLFFSSCLFFLFCFCFFRFSQPDFFSLLDSCPASFRWEKLRWKTQGPRIYFERKTVKQWNVIFIGILYPEFHPITSSRYLYSLSNSCWEEKTTRSDRMKFRLGTRLGPTLGRDWLIIKRAPFWILIRTNLVTRFPWYFFFEKVWWVAALYTDDNSNCISSSHELRQ